MTLSQLSRYRSICNNYRSYKEATGKLIFHMLKRGHPAQQLQRAFKIHLASKALNLPTNNRRTRKSIGAIVNWFNRMMIWVIHHPDVQPFTASSDVPHINNTIPVNTGIVVGVDVTNGNNTGNNSNNVSNNVFPQTSIVSSLSSRTRSKIKANVYLANL